VSSFIDNDIFYVTFEYALIHILCLCIMSRYQWELDMFIVVFKVSLVAYILTNVSKAPPLRQHFGMVTKAQDSLTGI